MNQWRHIETAPKATDLLVWDGGLTHIARKTGFEWLVYFGAASCSVKPTHWMPLPEPPKAETEAAEVQL